MKQSRMNRRLAVAMAAGFLLTVVAGFAQPTPPSTPPPTTSSTGMATPSNFPGRSGIGQNTGPKPYTEVITAKAKTDRGLFVTHKVEEKYYFEIPDSLLGREILVVNRIAKAPAGPRAGFIGYAGDIIGKSEISFQKGPNNKIFMRSLSFDEAGRDSAGMYNAVRNSNLQPIVAAFDIKALAKDTVTNATGSVIEVTDYMMGDNDILFFAANTKRTLGLSSYQRETSYINEVVSFPTNIEIKTVKTYMRTPTPSGGGLTFNFGAPSSGSPSTFELNSSMILLPKDPMKPRYFDPRIGFFATGYTDFDVNPQGVERVQIVVRWRLEPKPEDVEKYKRGELVEPAKPIVYHIDPATPKKWVPYLIQGVNDWQKAFEKAGFKNAIMAKMAPTNDATWSLEDARHSAIVYKPSDIPNASGPNVHDPRSGEILESHINWYHNVMSLVRDWYFIQTAAVDPRARQLVFPDSLMGELIRFVSSHEVGHTLGLRHNYGSSSTVPVENLRNKTWVEANGHTPSIMDYARFNYVAQPEDKITDKGLFPRIGDYDMWAIEWGYRWMPDHKTAQDEVPVLNKLTMEKLKNNKRLWFGTEVDPDDPRGQNEDLGDDAMKASAYGIKNLQRIITNLPEWTKEANRDYRGLTQMYGQLTSQFQRYMGHVSKYIGGIQTTPRMQEEAGMVIEYTPKAKQKEAMQFLQAQLFTTPIWLKQSKIEALINTNAMTTILGVQNSIIGRLLSNNTFNKLFRYEASGNKNVYTASEMVGDLRKGIWSELAGRKPIDIYRRNLQKAFVEQLVGNLKSDGLPTITVSSGRGFSMPSDFSRTTDAMSIAKAQLRLLQTDIRSALPTYKDAASRAHLQDVSDRITEVLEPK